MDSHVNHMQVTTQARFDVRGNPTQVRQYSFYIDKNGPFTLDYGPGEDTAAKVTADIDAICQHLRSVGALPSGY